jgi:predicted ATPase
MSSDSLPRIGDLPENEMLHVEEQCNRFENAWKAWRSGPRPSLEEYLAGVTGPAWTVLLCELLHVELEYRRRHHEVPIPAEYLPHFLGHEALLQGVFEENALGGQGCQLSTGPFHPAEPAPDPGPTSDRDSIRPSLPPSPEPLAPGTLIDHYRVLGPPRPGGMGEVYKAYDTRLCRDVALKLVRPEYAGDPDRLARFRHEALAASGLNHPNVCTVHAEGEHAGRPYLVMEWVEGRTLRELMGPTLCPKEVARLGRQVARALRAVHAREIVHRDIKPANVMVRDEDGYVKVLDFGLARLLPSGPAAGPTPAAAPTEPGLLVGTLPYMSPEQARGEAVDSASDIFSLGIVLYELATGRHPFAGDGPLGVRDAILGQEPLSPSRLRPEIPAGLESLVLQMLNKDARLRPTAAEVDAGLAAHEDPRPPQFRRNTVGREREREELWAGLDAAAAGRGLFLCLAGEPGIGKTTLVEEFLAELTSTGPQCHVARGRCSERLAGTEAYLPFLEALEGLLRGDAAASLARLLRTLAPTWYAEITPSALGDAAAPAAQASSQARLKRELLAFLQEAARARPLVLFFDDLHWADAATVDLLSYLGSHGGGERWLFVLTYRPTNLELGKHPFLQVKGELQGRGICREVPLDYLSRQDIDGYLTLEFPGHRFPAELAALVHGRTGGNPLFMADLLRYLRDRGALAREEDRWVLARPVADIKDELPETVRLMVRRKVDQLGAAERRLLVAASVRGHEFDAAVVARALELDPVEVEERLEALDRVHGLVRLLREEELPDGTLTRRYAFVHVLYENALYNPLGPAQRASLSKAVAEALLAFHGEKTESLAAELAFLFEKAREFDRAADYFRQAAQDAARVFAPREAVALARRGLKQAGKLPETPARASRELALQMVLGMQLQIIEGFAAPEAERAYLRARALCEQGHGLTNRFAVLTGLWGFYLSRAELPTARELAEELFGLAQQLADPARLLVAHYALAQVLLRLGNLPAAREHLRPELLPVGDPVFEPFLQGIDAGVAWLVWCAVNLGLLGHADQALARSRDAIAVAERNANPHSVVYAQFYAGMIYQRRREWRATLARAEAALALAAEQGFYLWSACATSLRGWALAEGGSRAEGIAQMHQGLEALQAIGSKLGRPTFLMFLGEQLAREGRAEEGLAAVAEALELGKSTGERLYEAELHRLRGELLLLRAAAGAPPAEAEACFRRAIDVARRQSAKHPELRAVVSLSRLYQEQGRKEEALGMLAEIYGWFTEGLDTVDLQEAKRMIEELS